MQSVLGTSKPAVLLQCCREVPCSSTVCAKAAAAGPWFEQLSQGGGWLLPARVWPKSKSTDETEDVGDRDHFYYLSFYVRLLD